MASPQAVHAKLPLFRLQGFDAGIFAPPPSVSQEDTEAQKLGLSERTEVNKASDISRTLLHKLQCM